MYYELITEQIEHFVDEFWQGAQYMENCKEREQYLKDKAKEKAGIKVIRFNKNVKKMYKNVLISKTDKK